MKQLKYILYILVTVFGCTACETYGDYDIEYSSIHPLGGMYSVTITDEAGTSLGKNYAYLANTTDNSKTQCWLRIGSYAQSPTAAFGINGKINCDLNGLSFAGTDIENLAGNVVTSTTTFSVANGKLVLNGATPPSGGKSDAISFTFTNSLFPGKTYTVTGYRYTGWSGD